MVRVVPPLQTIDVAVTGVNDNVPVITSTSNLFVPENSTAVLTLTATDGDLPMQNLSFEIVESFDGNKFSMTPNGVLSFASPPDFESPTDFNGDNIYSFLVLVRDGDLEEDSTLLGFQVITVTVTGVNDNSPIFTSPTLVSIPENTVSVLTVTATDADLPAQSLTYSIVGGADQSKFSITSGGALSFKSAPNFEIPDRRQWGQRLRRHGASERW